MYYEFKGEYSQARVFAKQIETAAQQQITDLVNDPYSKGSIIRIMPDVHAGAGNVIGLTMTITNKVAPSLVGPDIGCGVMLQEFKTNKKIDLKNLDEYIRKNIPHEPGIQKNISEPHLIGINELHNRLRADVGMGTMINSIGTLGGGNHFIELYDGIKCKDGYRYYLAIHSGSRSLGGAIYKHYQSKTRDHLKDRYEALRDSTIEYLKEQRKYNEIELRLKELEDEYHSNRKDADSIKYLIDQDMEDYLHDLGVTQKFAFFNRLSMMAEILKGIEADETKIERIQLVDKPHNYVDLDRNILRRGSQSAERDETVLIPINMRDGMILGRARGISDWNYSAPHGAGRVMSRTQAREELDLEVFREQMKNVYSTSVGQATLDEAPDAYKSMAEIGEHAVHLMQPGSMKILRPLYNYKSPGEK
jgi:tRNA-splicing ligase RtcB